MFNPFRLFRREDRLFGAKRSKDWGKIRKEFLKTNPVCAACGGKKKNEVHHIKPFHLHPELELDLTNFINLCETKENGVRCHQFFGHLGSYHSYNPNVESDAKIWRNKLATRP